MELLQIRFPVSGVETLVLLPPAAAFIISFFTSMTGISGAFLLLSFQVSVLGFISPAVTSTNFLYNVVGTPGGVLRYFREKRMVWPLAACIITGSLPGVLLGYYCRVRLLPDPKVFKLFIGIVLLLVWFSTARSRLTRGSLLHLTGCWAYCSEPVDCWACTAAPDGSIECPNVPSRRF